jgi:hypothetical protein
MRRPFLVGGKIERCHNGSDHVELLLVTFLAIAGMCWTAVAMYRANRSNKTPSSSGTRHNRPAAQPDDEALGSFPQEVVGEASYQQAFISFMGPICADGRTAVVSVDVVPDDANKHDENAVAVMVGGDVVGYLPRAAAARYRKAFGNASTQCRGRVVGGRTGENYGIWLDLKIPRPSRRKA